MDLAEIQPVIEALPVERQLARLDWLAGRDNPRRMTLARFRPIDRPADLKTNGLRKLAEPFPGVAHPSDSLSFHPFQCISVLIELRRQGSSHAR
jgi:hypothetical protein